MNDLEILNQRIRYADDNLDCTVLHPESRSYWIGYKEALEQLKKDCLTSAREAWEAYGESIRGV